MTTTIRELKNQKTKLLKEFKKLCNEEVKLKNDIQMGKERSKRMSVRTLNAKEAKRKTMNSKISSMRKKILKIEATIDKQ